MGGIAELAKTVFIWMLRLTFVAGVIFGFIVVLNITQSMLSIGLNGSVLSDLFGLFQLWLPFNLNTILLWFTTATIAFLAYRLSVFALTFINRLLSNT